ncbi:hypothetical protein [Rufibacter hautae]|uniref:hypothetical protein n=1 Tax=Rufibacter hautae TaxID=2595005 RepID=UPI001680FDA8|nr:hypothetical protein [Rufibacter hautae]
METLTIFQLLLQVLCFLGSFTALVFAYVYLLSGHGASRQKKAFTSPGPFHL